MLLVDGRDETTFDFETEIEKLGCEIVRVASAEAAIEFLSGHVVAVVVLEFTRAYTGGLEVAAKIREVPKNSEIPIVFLTGSIPDKDIQDRAFALGATECVARPASAKAIAAKFRFDNCDQKRAPVNSVDRVVEDISAADTSLILENALDAVVGVDEQNNVIFWNQRAHETFGWSKEEIIGRDMTELIVPERLRQAHRSGLNRFVSTGRTVIQNRRIEISGLRKSGEEFPMELTVSSIKGANGYRFYSFMRDITEQVSKRKEIEDANTWLGEILNRIEAAVFLVDPKTTEVVFSNSAAQKSGLGQRFVSRDPTGNMSFVDEGGVPIPLELWPRARAAKGETLSGAKYFWKTSLGIHQYLAYASLIPAASGRADTAFVCLVDISQLHLTELKLRQSEEELRTLANSIPQLAWMADPDGSIFWYNERWYEYTGLRREDMHGDGWHSAHDPEILPKVLETYQRAISSGTPGSMEFPLRGKDGIFRWFLTRWTPVKNDSGKIVRWFGTNTDITAIREAQKLLERAVQQRTLELSESYSFVDSVLENIPNMIFVKDATDLRFLRFNRAGEKLIGLPRTKLLGKTDLELFPPSEAQHFQERDREVLSGKVIVDIPEEEISTATGAIRILHTKKIPVLDGNGEPRYLVGISEDITERKKLEEERLQLVRSKIEQKENARTSERLKFLSDATSTLVSSLEIESILSDLTKICIPTLADWCSVQLVQPNGKLKQLAVNHEDPEKVKWAWELHRKYPPKEDSPAGPPNVWRTGQSELVTEVDPELIRQSAQNDEHLEIMESLGLCSYLCVPIKVGGKTIGTLSLATSAESGRRLKEADLHLAEDLCSRAAIAVDNARLYREAKNLNQVKDEFLATLSHELRTPINVIQGRAELLLSEFDSLSKSELKKSLNIIQRNTRLQTQIVSDLLDVSSIITGKITYVPQLISPEEILKTVCETIRATAENKGITLNVEFDRAPASILADPTRLHQILWNLLNNAIKFTPAEGQISIKLSQDNGNCVFQIEDSGIGIDAQFLPYVFDRFKQADSSMSRSYGGLGLGLSIVKSLVEVHGGTVTVQSEGKGQGASFTVRLPIKTDYSYRAIPSEIAAPAEEDLKETEGLLNGFTILVVEDSPDNRDLISIFLQKKGARILLADSAAMAREVLKTHTPDLILSDIGMPGENGLEFMRRYRSECKSAFIPAVALTAYVRPLEIEETLAAGFQGHISKPVTSASLVGRILKVLEKSKGSKANDA